ncbi:cell division protein FtsQ/DivIB [Tepidimonas charontis]|uniref:Cell division protein FtsQ n=1 Tax=Tepidimonas charontis TaxID=2267262 RepID=A0A554XIS4_9BURK|nr:cell division protein FtsQ/DivIB [Tepidimonas charontis]TSE35727.1 Cell division protein FtsQ [Tepidimonas charontis]
MRNHRAAALPAVPFDVRLMNAVAAGLAVLAAAAALVVVAWWVARHPMWTVRVITLEGDVTHQTPALVRTLVLPHLQGTFLTLDLASARERFLLLPWVREAVVQRQFPNRLRVTLTEHEALAWWGDPTHGRLVSVRGEVFEAEPDDARAEQWAVLHGPAADAETVVAMYRRVLPLIERLGRDVARLELSERGAWRVTLDNGAPIELGRGDILAVERLQRFVATQPALRARYGPRDIVSADLRYPNGYAVQLRGVTTNVDPLAPSGRAAARPAAASTTTAAPRPSSR